MDLCQAEALIALSPDHRLLRRVPPPERWTLPQAQGEIRRAIFVDTETTGLDLASDEVIELALLPFDYNRESGVISRIDLSQSYAAFREPTVPIPEASTAIHGIARSDVAGQSVDAARVAQLIDSAHLVIAHNAAFDRPMVEKHWPVFEQKHWACSLADVDWKAEGLGSGKLDYLLMRQGWFHDAHRALGDAVAAVFLLTLPLPLSGASGMTALLQSARKPLRAVRAEETAFEQRAALRARGYKWDAGDRDRAKAWWKLTDDPQTEVDWLRSDIYRDKRDIQVVNMPATRRYSSRLWPRSA